MTIEKSGVYMYGNRQAFRTLANWMSAIADSDASEHLECHLLSHLNGKSVVLFDKKTGQISGNSGRKQGFDLTFQIVEAKDLQKLGKLKRLGRVPEGWRNLDIRRVPKSWR